MIDEVWVVDVGDPAYPRTPPPEPFRERMPQLNSAPADLPAKRRNRGRKAMIVQEDRLPAETPPVALVSRELLAAAGPGPWLAPGGRLLCGRAP